MSKWVLAVWVSIVKALDKMCGVEIAESQDTIPDLSAHGR
jgi:hypothetical protein